MHKYLKAIGYGDLASEDELRDLLRGAEGDFSRYVHVPSYDGIDYCETEEECAERMGIKLCGTLHTEFDEWTGAPYKFDRHYYYPYFLGRGVTSETDVTIQRRMDKEAYAGIIEDSKVGISLIFQLQNGAELFTKGKSDLQNLQNASVTLSGLCNGGTVLLPVLKNPEQEKRSLEESRNRMKLLSAARNGDPSAMESLTLDDIDIYSKISKRIVKEDIFTIVDTYFMPYGIECDRYSILGEIRTLDKTENWQTGEEIYLMGLNVNGLGFDVCVPVNSVLGEPAVGRRFKGNIWLQGSISME